MKWQDERNALFPCIFYDEIRLELKNKINSKYPFSNEFDHNSKIIFLFNNVDPFICRLISAFVFQAMNMIHEVSYKTKWRPVCYLIILSMLLDYKFHFNLLRSTKNAFIVQSKSRFLDYVFIDTDLPPPPPKTGRMTLFLAGSCVFSQMVERISLIFDYY